MRMKSFLGLCLVVLQMILVSPCEGKRSPSLLVLEKGEWVKHPLFDYPYNPSVDLAVWDKLAPHFLPSNHPFKAFLDLIFQSDRVTLSVESFSAAGFKIESLPTSPRHVIVGSHPLLKGYLVKAYLDTQTMCEWENFLKRVTGAQSIKTCIQKHGYQKYFNVPEKWIYPLPLNSLPPNDPQYHQKNFILVVEEMHLLNHHENGKAFRSKITPEILNALYVILSKEGLSDSVIRRNIPFNSSGKLCFIDTEYHHIWPVDYHALTKSLSPEMQSYWQNLILRPNG